MRHPMSDAREILNMYRRTQLWRALQFCFLVGLALSAAAFQGCSLLDKQKEPEVLTLTTDQGDTPSVGRKKKVSVRLVTTDADNDELDFVFTASGGTFTKSMNDTLQDLFQDSVTVEWEAPSNPGSYDLMLEISDGKSEARVTSAIRVVVTQSAPLAEAGLTQVLAYGDTLRVVLDGTGSFDPDDDLLRFEWEQIGGPSVLRGSVANRAEPDFLAPAPGDYIFVLRVSDDAADTTGALTSGSDTVRVRVSDRAGRNP